METQPEIDFPVTNFSSDSILGLQVLYYLDQGHHKERVAMLLESKKVSRKDFFNAAEIYLQARKEEQNGIFLEVKNALEDLKKLVNLLRDYQDEKVSDHENYYTRFRQFMNGQKINFSGDIEIKDSDDLVDYIQGFQDYICIKLRSWARSA